MNLRGFYFQDKRAKLPKGMQEELVLLAKKSSNLTWPKMALLFDVSVHTVKIVWRHERTTIPYKFYSHLLKMVPRNQRNIFLQNTRTLEKNWGQSKGGRASIDKIRFQNNITPIKNIIGNSGFSEFVGIMLGDGHLSEKGMRITLEYPYELDYAKYVAALIKKIFGIEPKIYPYTKHGREIRVIVNSIALSSFLKKVGMQTGDKVKNNVGIPPFIFKDRHLLMACIRGLIDTDGGFFAKDAKRTRIFMEFSSHTLKLRSDFRFGLEKLGFHTSRSNYRGVRIQNQAEVLRLISTIGTRNPNTVKKLGLFSNSGRMPLTKEIYSNLGALVV